jgi:hypothetical protein
LFARSFSHRIAAGALIRRMPLEGGTLSYGGTACYRLARRSSWQPVLRAVVTAAPDVGVSTGYLDFGAHAGIGRVWDFGTILMRVEALVGYEHLAQYARAETTRHTSVLPYLGQIGVEVPWGSLLFFADGAVGGRVFKILDKGWVHRLDLAVSVGSGWRWGE